MVFHAACRGLTTGSGRTRPELSHACNQDAIASSISLIGFFGGLPKRTASRNIRGYRNITLVFIAPENFNEIFRLLVSTMAIPCLRLSTLSPKAGHIPMSDLGFT